MAAAVQAVLTANAANTVERKPPARETVIRALIDEVIETTTRSIEAERAFNTVADQAPSIIGTPDGVRLLEDASRELTMARDAAVKAHNRLNASLQRAMVARRRRRLIWAS